jgi:hypothetical protein
LLGPVSISVSGSPRSSQALTEPMCGSGSRMAVTVGGCAGIT